MFYFKVVNENLLKIFVVIFILNWQQKNASATPEQIYNTAENHEEFERKSGLVFLERSRRNHLAQAKRGNADSQEINDDPGLLQKRQIQIPYNSDLLPRPISPVLSNRQGSPTRFLLPRQSSALAPFLDFEENQEEEEQQQGNPNGIERNRILTLRKFHPLPFTPGELQKRYQLLKPRNPGQNNFQLQSQPQLPFIQNGPGPGPGFISPQIQPLVNNNFQLNSNYPVKTPVFQTVLQNNGGHQPFYIPFNGQHQFHFRQPLVTLPNGFPNGVPLINTQSQLEQPFRIVPKTAPIYQPYRIVQKTAPLYYVGQQPTLLPLGFHYHQPGVHLNTFVGKQPFGNAFQPQLNTQRPPNYTYFPPQSNAPAPPNYNFKPLNAPAPPNYNFGQQPNPTTPNYNYFEQRGPTPTPPSYNYFDQRRPTPETVTYYNDFGRTRSTPAPPDYSYRTQTRDSFSYNNKFDQSGSDRQSNSYNPNPPLRFQGNAQGNLFQPSYLKTNDQRQVMQSYHRMINQFNRDNIREIPSANAQFPARFQQQRTFLTERQLPKFFIIDRNPNPSFPPLLPLIQF